MFILLINKALTKVFVYNRDQYNKNLTQAVLKILRLVAWQTFFNFVLKFN